MQSVSLRETGGHGEGEGVLFFFYLFLPFLDSKQERTGTSLAIQWLRLCLPV